MSVKRKDEEIYPLYIIQNLYSLYCILCVVCTRSYVYLTSQLYSIIFYYKKLTYKYTLYNKQNTFIIELIEKFINFVYFLSKQMEKKLTINLNLH